MEDDMKSKYVFVEWETASVEPYYWTIVFIFGFILCVSVPTLIILFVEDIENWRLLYSVALYIVGFMLLYMAIETIPEIKKHENVERIIFHLNEDDTAFIGDNIEIFYDLIMQILYDLNIEFTTHEDVESFTFHFEKVFTCSNDYSIGVDFGRVLYKSWKFIDGMEIIIGPIYNENVPDIRKVQNEISLRMTKKFEEFKFSPAEKPQFHHK
jgi:hypothetical protein